MAADTPREPIGFVGLGAMGGPMVGQLATHGHEVLGYDLDAAKVEAAARLSGVTGAASLSELARVSLVICMLPDSDAVEEALRGPGGLLSSLEPDAIIVDMSSSDPRRTVELATVAADGGVSLVDSPVSGGLARARGGELTTMFGGTAEQLARCRPALEAMAGKMIPMGSLGAGHAVKALNNVASAVGLSVACEVVEVGRRYGLEPSLILEVLNQSTGRNHASETKIDRFVLSESFDSGFLLRLMLKDLALATDLAEEVGVPTPIAAACRELWSEAERKLGPDADQTEIARIFSAHLEGSDLGGQVGHRPS